MVSVIKQGNKIVATTNKKHDLLIVAKTLAVVAVLVGIVAYHFVTLEQVKQSSFENGARTVKNILLEK